MIGFELDPKLLAGLTFNIMAQTGESTSDSKQGETGKDSKMIALTLYQHRLVTKTKISV